MSATSITTTLKLTEALKARIGRVAAEAGKSSHAFMLEAIERHTALAERRRDFVASALRAEEEVAQYGLVYDGDEVLSWFQSRLEGKATRPPRKRRLQRAMARLVFAPCALSDLGRVADFLLRQSAVDAAATAPLISSALQIPKQHPTIGRGAEAGLRELLISRGHSGSVALYRYDTASDTVVVLAIRHQREQH
jgi:plasmid stabilization system protein ParE/predicted transcriptional regulator